MQTPTGESALLRVPPAQWHQLVAAIRKAQDAVNAEVLQLARELHPKVEDELQCRPTKTVRRAIANVVLAEEDRLEPIFARLGCWYLLTRALIRFDSISDTEVLRPLSAAAQALDATEDQFHFLVDDATITLRPPRCEVLWEVPSAPGALERAHNMAMARSFFAALEAIEWAPGTGGVLTRTAAGGREEVARYGQPDVSAA